MPNRIIKESICTSEDIDSLSPEEEVLFYRLIVNCDDYGRMDGRVQIIKAKCFPWKEKLSLAQVEKWLFRLASQGMVLLYTVEDKRYLQMTKWAEHQQIRANKSKFPSFDEEGSNLISTDINGNQLQANVPVSVSVSESDKRKRDPKNKYAEFVSMTETEYQKLVDAHGEDAAKQMIERLNNYKGANGKTYKNDYLAILNWVKDKVIEQQQAKAGNGGTKEPPPRRITDDERKMAKFIQEIEGVN